MLTQRTDMSKYGGIRQMSNLGGRFCGNMNKSTVEHQRTKELAFPVKNAVLMLIERISLKVAEVKSSNSS